MHSNLLSTRSFVQKASIRACSIVIMITYAIMQSKSKRATKPEILIQHILTSSTATFPTLDLAHNQYDETDVIPADNPEGCHIMFRARIPRTDSSSCYAVRRGWKVDVLSARDKHLE
ncbi:hypothetical protein HBH98_170720 [Parastagonospora nodorum]|nr:hypothetical protein HBH51_182210 [Parastagonospora nodorum]KAH3968503.1 hypothetical protein HBH52_178930 [Parastagonospora nodorum]KAH4024751.1 hypothetical protein HBI09_157930 [Parastagonospora nodorum]KAH4163822.1 hypothetical protein HBH43_155510 [Parastagonospora nodorum]KAH4185599.1 hypothetical protein HBH42_174000 [Parastagonospora nodorum]